MSGPSRVRDYKDLIVWQRSLELSGVCHEIVSSMPRGERGELGSQIRRAAISVPANIAEGHSRPGRGEYLNFLGIAYASLKEVECHLYILERLGHRSAAITRALSLSDECSRMLTVLRRRLSERDAVYPQR